MWDVEIVVQRELWDAGWGTEPPGVRSFVHSFIPLPFAEGKCTKTSLGELQEQLRDAKVGQHRGGVKGTPIQLRVVEGIPIQAVPDSRASRPSREGRLQHPTSCGPRRLLEISIKLPLKTPAFQEAMDMEQPLGGRKQSFRQEESTTAPGEDGSFPQQGKGYSGAARGHLHLFQPLSSPLPSAIQWHRHHRVHCGQSWLLQGPRSLLRGDRKPRGHPRTPLTMDSPSEVLPSVFPEAELGLLVLLAPQK